MKIDGLEINYIKKGEGRPIVFLHGWGVNKETFKDISDHLTECACYLIDLPGFGESEEPKRGFNLDYYVKIVHDFVDSQEIKNPILVGHSFGGRIAIRYSTVYDVDSLVLIDSAGLKHHNIGLYLKVYSYKIMKKLGIKMKTGSHDYQMASPIMKEVLKNVVCEDQKEDLKKIKVKTLIVWGENDDVTPVSDGFMMEKLIEDAGLVIIPNVGHYSYLENPSYFSIVLDSFLAVDKK